MYRLDKVSSNISAREEKNACYGGFVEIDCAPNRIFMEREFYGRHPDENCEPSFGRNDCGTDGTFYMVRCPCFTRPEIV